MADYSITSDVEAFGMQFDRKSAQIRCAMPGLIQSFDPATQTAVVQPAIKMKVNLDDGTKQMDLPPIQGVPVVLPFAQSAGLLLTLPLAGGDECLLVFSDRAMDNFVQSGGLQPALTGEGVDDETTAPRSHSLSDAICIPGIISNPQAVPAYNSQNIELRDRERKNYISLGPQGIEMTDGQAVWKMSGGKVDLSAPAGIAYQTPAEMTVQSQNMDLGASNRIKGSLTSETGSFIAEAGTFIDKDGVTLNTHVHKGVVAGGSNTQEPLK